MAYNAHVTKDTLQSTDKGDSNGIGWLLNGRARSAIRRFARTRHRTPIVQHVNVASHLSDFRAVPCYERVPDDPKRILAEHLLIAQGSDARRSTCYEDARINRQLASKAARQTH